MPGRIRIAIRSRQIYILLILALLQLLLISPCSSQRHEWDSITRTCRFRVRPVGKKQCGCPPDYNVTRSVHSAFFYEVHHRGPAKLWPGGLIYYEIDSQFDTHFHPVIIDGMEYLQNLVGLDHLEFISLRNKDGILCHQEQRLFFKRELRLPVCHGSSGMASSNVTEIHLHQDMCDAREAIIVPLITVLGFQREHNRYDRDKYIKLRPEEINTNDCALFMRREVPDATENLPYDHLSIMHGSSCEDSCRGKPTAVTANGTGLFFPSWNLTRLDVEKLRALYPKSKKVKAPALQCDDIALGDADKKERETPNLEQSTDNSSPQFVPSWNWILYVGVAMAMIVISRIIDHRLE